jgi:hypothetical protein
VTSSPEIKLLKKRIEKFSKETLLVDQSGRFIQVYKGCTHLMTLEAFSLFDSCIADKTFLARATRIESFSNTSGSKFTLNLNNGQSKRISLRLEIKDFLVSSILQALKFVLPEKFYEKLNQDFLDILMKCNIELARLTN